MSQFTVVTAALEEVAGRLGGVAPGAHGFHGQVRAHASAAAGTPAHEALSALMTRWAAVLPQVAESGDRLQAAVRGASQVYAATDQAVADKADGVLRTSTPAAADP